jgi:putative DNA primase/helicase
LRKIEPDMPESLNAAGDRAPDAWEPLVAIADVAGGVWPQRARNAALALTGVDMAALSDSDVDIELLPDIDQILNACDIFAATAEQKEQQARCSRGAGSSQPR